MRPVQKEWILAGSATAAMLAWTLVGGFASVPNSSFRSASAIVDGALESPIRLVFPILVTLICVPGISAQLANRYLVYARTRTQLRLYLAKRIGRLTLRCFVLVFLYSAIVVGVLYWVAPLVFPHVIDPATYNAANEVEAAAQEAQISPLSTLITISPILYVVVSGAWTAINGALFGLVGIVIAFLIEKRYVAWLAPLAFYIIESIPFQLSTNFFAASFLSSAVSPEGSAGYPLVQAIVALGAFALVVAVGLVWVLVRAPQNGRLV